jgi:DNA polymerase IV
VLRILFIDFNSYFASVEQQLDPALRGRPVGVLPVLADTTCCIAASIEAKVFGVRTGTPVREARKLCPQIVFVQAQHAKYVRIHQRAVQIIDSVVPVLKVMSIDEMACELPQRFASPQAARDLALLVKARLAQELGPYLRTSIGLAPNIFLAKTASDMHKPDGLVAIDLADLPQALFTLKPAHLNGIGPRMNARLARHGIDTVEKLWNLNRAQLRAIWGGIEGEIFYEKLRGVEVARPVNPTQSISHSHVLPPELRTVQGALGVLDRLTQKAAMRLRKAGLLASGLSIGVRFKQPAGLRWGQEAGLIPTDLSSEFVHALYALWQRGARWQQQAGVEPLKVGMALHRQFV